MSLMKIVERMRHRGETQMAMREKLSDSRAPFSKPDPDHLSVRYRVFSTRIRYFPY